MSLQINIFDKVWQSCQNFKGSDIENLNMGHSMMRKKEIFRVTTVSTKVTGLKVLVKFGMNLDKSHCLPPEKNIVDFSSDHSSK